jgi:hypothetical protein
MAFWEFMISEPVGLWGSTIKRDLMVWWYGCTAFTLECGHCAPEMRKREGVRAINGSQVESFSYTHL